MSNQLKFGIFTAGGLFALVILIIAVGTFSLEKTYSIYVRFNNISDLTRKAKVKIAGVDVGVLKSASLEDSKAKVRLLISSKVVLYQNASVRIVSTGIIGTKHIDITPGDAGFPVLKDGDYISSQENSDMMENLAESIYCLNEVLHNLAVHNNQITSIIDNFNKFSTDIASISEQNKQNLADTILSIKDISLKINVLINRLYNGDGPISTLINDVQMGKDLKETVTSAKETVNILNKTIKKAETLQLNWEYTGKYNIKDKKYINDAGIRIMPNNHKFYYIGISNLADTHNITDENEKKNINTLDALIGFRSTKAEVYGGVMRNRAGIGFGYSFFEPIYTLKAQLNTYDFSRDKHGPLIDVGIKFGITKWFYAGIGVEDITHKAAVTSYLNIEINDKDLASLLGILSLPFTVSR
jgi:phospholipid/cholesterol/gamma-HCH transport system substrate-binding protein